MSLILEALKKLEREKHTPADRGFLVVAHVPWPADGRGRSLWLGSLGALVGVGLVAFFLLRAREGRGTPTTPQPLATTKAPPESSAPRATLAPEVAPPGFSPPAANPVPASTLPALPSPSPPAPRTSLPAVPPEAVARPATPAPSPARESELRLNAITRQEGRPVAVLNDRVVREGDIFDGIHVIRIGEAEVEVEVNGKRRIVRF